MMEESVSQNEALGMGLGIISGEADRLKDMVEELLDFSRLESSRMKVAKRKLIQNTCSSRYIDSFSQELPI
jgi:hypothetical protein